MTNDKMAHEHCCLAYKPILAGALVAIGLTFLFNLFSVAISLTAFTTSSDGLEALAFGGLVGTAIGILASMFAAGWLTGYLGQRYSTHRHLGALYGFLAWVVALMIGVFITSHVQEYVTFYGHFLSGTTHSMQVGSTAAGSSNVMVTTTMSANNLAISAYIIFSLFFLSAFACSLGGHCGMHHVCKNKKGIC